MHLDHLNEHKHLSNLNLLISHLDKMLYDEPLLTTNVENLPLPVGDRSYTLNLPLPVGDRSYTLNLPLPVGDRSYTVNYIDENSRKNQIRMWTNIINAKDNKKLINWNGTSEGITELADIDDLKKHFEAKGN